MGRKFWVGENHCDDRDYCGCVVERARGGNSGYTRWKEEMVAVMLFQDSGAVGRIPHIPSFPDCGKIIFPFLDENGHMQEEI